jgi:hypothetical protein
MSGYSFELAIRSLRRNFMLTALMVAAVGVGIGTSMTMLTTLGPHRMSPAYACVGALLVLVLCQLAVPWPALRGLCPAGHSDARSVVGTGRP